MAISRYSMNVRLASIKTEERAKVEQMIQEGFGARGIHNETGIAIGVINAVFQAEAEKARAQAAAAPVAVRRSTPAETRDQAVTRIAREFLNVSTLVPSNSDGADFHDLAVWSIQDALNAAYEAGRAAK